MMHLENAAKHFWELGHFRFSPRSGLIFERVAHFSKFPSSPIRQLRRIWSPHHVSSQAFFCEIQSLLQPAKAVERARMTLFVLTETSAGYALLKAKDKKLLKQDDLAAKTETAEGVTNL